MEIITLDNSFKVSTFPSSRVATFDVGVIGRKKHHIIGLLEIDITDAKNNIKEKIKNGNKCSFMSWVLKCIGTTIADFKQVHAINTKHNKQVVFNNIDISFPLEKKVSGIRVPIPAIIRDVNNCSVSDIYEQLENMSSISISNKEDFVINDRKSNKRNKLFFILPQKIRLLIWNLILKNPLSIKKNMGTVMVTNVSLLGNASGWIIPKSIHNISFGIGSINKKPWIVDNEIKIREIMKLTILFDHDVVDGMPAAKFVSKLTLNMEKAKWT